MEKRCSSCKQFKEMNNYKNDGAFCISRPYFKLCFDCRERAKCYQVHHRVKCKLPKQKYSKRDSEYRDPSDRPCNMFEVEPYIMYEPCNMICFVKPGDLLLFVGDYHLSEYKFSTLDEARDFRDWAMGVFSNHML